MGNLIKEEGGIMYYEEGTKENPWEEISWLSSLVQLDF
jgi:hypothetical protein